MNILIVLPEGGFSNTSSSIFSELFLSRLARHYDIDLVGFALPEDYLFGLRKPGFIRRYISLDSSFVRKRAPRKSVSSFESEKRDSFSWVSRVKGILKSITKAVIPDFFALGALDMRSENESFDRYEYIISMSDPKSAHYLALYLRKNIKQLRGAFYIQIWGDPWYHDITKEEVWMSKLSEYLTLRKAGLVFYRSSATLKLQQKTFPRLSGKMHIIHRGFNGSLPVGIHEIKKERYSFVYAGDYHPAIRNLVTFSKLVGKYGHTLTLYGNTSEACRTELAKLDGVSQYERVPKSEVEEQIEKRDCVVIALNLRGSQIPGKIYDLIPLNKPVLLLVDGDLDVKDIPALNRFLLVHNNYDDIDLFLKNLKSLKVSFDESLNNYHIDKVVEEFKARIDGGVHL